MNDGKKMTLTIRSTARTSVAKYGFWFPAPNVIAVMTEYVDIRNCSIRSVKIVYGVSERDCSADNGKKGEVGFSAKNTMPVMGCFCVNGLMLLP
ncbi:MAG: hypothetical protein ACNI3A_02390 [Desulfovibrio sp.]|uniref:hypothetical protein n=1 Tax=Desulfovibrio sp. 7SRBS1 TaxID=3378064 RepID=UPI003B3C78FC